MTRFRPCIDLHQGHVKQIVGSSLRDGASPVENYVSSHGAGWYASLYRRDGLTGGHVILLGAGNESAAEEALRAWPGGLQVGGGIHPENAAGWIEKGASHVIVTSWIFTDDRLDLQKVRELSATVGPQHLVLDLSCRQYNDGWRVATNRWQTITQTAVDPELLEQLAPYCSEFLVHAADVEGLQQGMDDALIAMLARHAPLPTTYAGGARSLSDLERMDTLSHGRLDLTIGSALDIFGGKGARYEDCVRFNQSHSTHN